MSNFHIPTKVLSLIDTRPKDNEVKGAVKLDPNVGLYFSDKTAAVATANAAVLPLQHTFTTFDKQDQPLSDFITKLCIQLGLQSKNTNVALDKEYALMFDDRLCFLTEQNKHKIQQGFILKLTVSPNTYALYFLTKMSSSNRPLTSEQLSIFGSLCMDPEFVDAFYKHQGIERLIGIIEEAADWHPFFDTNGSGSMLLGLMHALLQLMQLFSNLFPWNHISTQFVRKIAFFVNGQSKLEQNDSRALALDMLLMLEHCEHLQECLKRDIPVDSLIRHLDNSDQRILQGSLALMNAIYALADREERIGIVRTLHERPFIAAISRVLAKERPNNVILTGDKESLKPGLEQKIRLWDQLARLQHIRFDEVRALALRSPSDNEIDFLKTLDEFNFNDQNSKQLTGLMLSKYQLQHEQNGVERANVDGFYENGPFKRTNKQRFEADWLAFRKMVQSTPPGLLAICAILDITRSPQSHTEQQQSFITQMNQVWAKFQELNVYFAGRCSLFPQILSHLATILIQVLGICGNSSVGQRFGISRQPRFWRIVLKCERPFYDLFRILVELFHRTWRDMNAKPDEINKVYSVVQDQIERAMVEDPDSLKQLEVEMLRKRFSYSNMQKIWKQEQSEQDELEMNSNDIQPLYDHLRPKFESLACCRRIALLKKGLTFQRVLPLKTLKDNPQTSISSSSALSSSTAVYSSPVHSVPHSNLHNQSLSFSQHWFWRLDERERNFNFWDCRLSDGKHTELILESQGKLPVTQIRTLIHGADLGTRLSQQHGLKLHKKGHNLLRCGFCLDTHSNCEYYFCARNEQDLANWLESLNCLCWPQQALQNASIRTEVDRLLRLEVHIRLMDIPRLAMMDKKESLEKENKQTLEIPTDLSWIPRELLKNTSVKT